MKPISDLSPGIPSTFKTAPSSSPFRRRRCDAFCSTTAEKRASGEKVMLEEIGEISVKANETLIELDLALQELEEFDPKQAKIVEVRYFGGLTIE